MSQERTLNVDDIVLRKTRQDREQAQDLDTLISVILQLKAENEKLIEKVKCLELQVESPVCAPA